MQTESFQVVRYELSQADELVVFFEYRFMLFLVVGAQASAATAREDRTERVDRSDELLPHGGEKVGNLASGWWWLVVPGGGRWWWRDYAAVMDDVLMLSGHSLTG
jgi:hypothetical protein